VPEDRTNPTPDPDEPSAEPELPASGEELDDPEDDLAVQPIGTQFLLRDARTGDQRAWRELYERYRAMLLVAIGVRMPSFLQRLFDAEDVLQEAFVKAWAKIDTFEYRGEGSFRLWLQKIVFHSFRNLIRAQKGEQQKLRTSSEREMAEALARVPRPSQLISEIESLERIFEKLAQLPDESRELITMRIFEKKSFQEIGEILGISRVLASQRFSKAIAEVTRAVG
jgi:RNA polymerase sigma-70 factor (ECF subfamily)